MWKFSLLLIFSILFSKKTYSQAIPDDMLIPICDNQSMSMGAPGNSGIYNLALPCNVWQPLSPYLDFYYIRILSGTTFTFLVTPYGQDDYDFGAWLNPNWNDVSSTPSNRTRGSQNDPFQTMEFTLGLSLTATDLCETGGSSGIPEPGKVRYFDVQAGDEILIAIDRWSQTTQGYSISFGGDAILDCTVLGDSYGKCDYDENGVEEFISNDFIPSLIDEFPNHNFKFFATQQEAEAGNGPLLNFPFTVAYNDGDPTNIYVRIENLQGSFIRVLKLFLFVNKIPELLVPEVELPLLCDPDGDGLEVFDLTQSEGLFVANSAAYSFKYYTNLAAAEAGGNDHIQNPAAYNSGSTTLFVRVDSGPQEGNEEGCFVVGELILKVSDFYVEEQDLTMDGLCDENGDGNIVVDLTENNTQIVANPNDYIITYHLNELDAQNGNNPIANPTAYTISAGVNVTIFVRVKSATDHCYSISRLNYFTIEKPILTVLDDVDLCVDETDWNIDFDLTVFAGQIVNNPQDFNITYHSSLLDAENGSNAIANPNAYAIPVNATTTIYIRVENDGCPSVGSVDIKITSNPALNDDLVVGPICDEDGNGFLIVDLTDTATYFIANPNDFEITYHLNLTDAETGANPIANPTTFQITAGHTVEIYIRVKSPFADCYSVRKITYQTTEKPILNDLTDVELCTDVQGNYEFDLTVFAAEIVANPNDYVMTYHHSLADAQTGQNPIVNPAVYLIPIDTTATIYVRVENEGCADFKMVNISIHANPILSNLPAQVFCTNEQNGHIPYNLTQHQSEWIANSTQFSFSYHTSQQDAENGVNAIANPAAYAIPVGGTTFVYVRVENPNSHCFSITVLELKPGATATLNEGLIISLCDDDFDGFYQYNLNELNAQLVASANGLSFAYYLSETNAINQQNPIPQNQWANYQMGNLPHSVWVVATTADACSSEPVEVIFKKETQISTLVSTIGPISYCPDETIDLTSFEIDMTNETVVFTYHHQLYEAQNGLNPIANIAQFSPNGNNSVFVRLESADKCPAIVEIKFKKLATPSLELNESLVELCPGSAFEALAESDDPHAIFEWYVNDVYMGSGAQMNLTENGNYTVVVTGANGCINEATLVVVSPSSPQITGIEMGQNYIVVSAIGGSGHVVMEYSLDKIFWQTSPRFDNLIPGETYTIYVRLNSCMIDSYTVVLLSISNFISPNGDGINDTWSIRGIEVTPQATLKIFDRYGKIFVDTNFDGHYIWDGKYMGRSVASGDYWYIIDVPGDGIIKDRKFVGHISVRNR